ncbi:MAG: AmmeMemoRadiSam system protein A [Candidatus Sumerlaeaceae bacterium]|nr:AmmeMemoRadiSam system protein A [Candidatus Sumerlaeaceae bacterium]
MLTKEEQDALLRLARLAIGYFQSHGREPRLGEFPDILLTAAMQHPSGAFVSLHLHGELRGCIGIIEPTHPLAEAVIHNAIAAANRDPRFVPVTPRELKELEIEISVLGPLEPITHISEIVVGRHGLFIDSRAVRGLLLPQVATEYGWDSREFLEHTYRKAGLQPVPGLPDRIFRFEAAIFSDTPKH